MEKKYIGWDLEKFKSGWPAEHYGKPAKFVAHVPEVLEHMQLIWYSDGFTRYDSPITPRAPLRLLAREIDPHPDNKDGLYWDQVGYAEGWRIKGHDEARSAGDQYWGGADWFDRDSIGSGHHSNMTYRTRDPLPAPKKIPLGPEDIVLGKTVLRTVAGEKYLVLHTAKQFVTTNNDVLSWNELQQHDWEISFDHGTTWQRAEKEAPKP